MRINRLIVLVVPCLIASPLLAGVDWTTKQVAALDQYGGTVNGDSGGASALASSGANLFYLTRDFDTFFRSTDGGETWQLLDGPGARLGGHHGDWGSNTMAFWPAYINSNGVNTGALVIRQNDGSGWPEGQNKIAVCPLSKYSWQYLGTGLYTVMGNGMTVVANRLYGVWHAGGGNYGGPICRANLTLTGGLDERTVLVAASTTWPDGIAGRDPYWFSRVAQLTNVGGIIYGIKNDWASPQPAINPGDRLFRFDPTRFDVSAYAGLTPGQPNWQTGWWTDSNWSAHVTTNGVKDLGILPFEPGNGASLVPLPAHWSAEVGVQGGLFIIAGRSPANHEGWGGDGVSGAASSLYAIYDLASGTYSVGSLPDITGDGTSATFHNGKVYIKRGGAPGDPWNTTLWAASGNATDPCSSPYSLSIQSDPVGAGGVAIDVVPADCNGLSDGTTPFTRSFGVGQNVMFSAPEVPSYRFSEWQLSGPSYFFATDQTRVVISTNGVSTATAVYTLRCDLPVPFTIQSTPVDGISVSYSPADCAAGTSGLTPFTSSFGGGETVTFTAPCVPGYTFQEWAVDGEPASNAPSLTLTLDTQVFAEAVYVPASPPHIDGCLSFSTGVAPDDSSFASSMTSDGASLYYMRRDTYRLFRTSDGCTWTELRKITDDLAGWHGDWMSGSLGCYPGAGAQGSLIVRHRNPTDNVDKIARYDIAQDKWYWTSTFTVGGHGSVIVGNYRYGIWHAGGTNYGGPLCRVDLTTLGTTIIDQRTFISGSLAGAQKDWFSRAACLTAVDGKIYGIKNDWATNPASDGDRLYLFNPADWTSSLWTGTGPADYWNSAKWSARATFATDLGPLPFEPGYGSAIVGLPANWSCDIGNKGGLFIIAGRSPSNNEGWGNASSTYAVYDIATEQLRVGVLPGATGSGTSATFHNGKVYIKRGGNPDAPYNSELWIVSPVGAPGDHDGDGDVDLTDYLNFADCMEGPNTPPVPSLPGGTVAKCLSAFDFAPGDGDVDEPDFASFQDVFSAP